MTRPAWSFRALSIATPFVIACGLGGARAAPAVPAASFKPAANMSVRPLASPLDSLAAYRKFAVNQAENLVIMANALAGNIRDGELDSAQSSYAPAHRFLKRLEPILRTLPDLGARMDAQAASYAMTVADPDFAGFHRLEYGLFAKGSTDNLYGDAKRLQDDAKALLHRVATLDIKPGLLLDESTALVQDVAARTLAGEEERYSKTDLWDLEANLEGVRQVLELVRPQIRNQAAIDRTGLRFAEIDRVLEKNKLGCGFKDFDKVGKDDLDALRRSAAALAGELATLRGGFAMN